MPESIILTRALNWSGALRRKLAGDPGFQHWLEAGSVQALTRYTIHNWYDELIERRAEPLRNGGGRRPVLAAADLARVLRRLRERVFFTLMVRDINGAASLREVVTAMSILADLAVSQAYRSVANELAAVHGTPLDPQTGLPQELLVVAMGKLGGRELNVSSDIDLVLCYPANGTTCGPRPLSHQEFYTRVVQKMVSLLSDHDAHGFVFRCDLRLRPDGDSGPLVLSLPALEVYLVSQGREWERYAWLKARLIPCKAFADSDSRAHAEQFEALRTPFVYRKYFDFDALSALRQLRERIRQDWERRALARSGVDKTHNIKLGDGGIREVEFVVQLNQMIRGGRLPSLQQRGLHAALYKQRKAGVLPAALSQGLEDAYFFLRRLEHMLQYQEDEQTHLLPRRSEEREKLADAMGLTPEEFEKQLAEHREFVASSFRDAFRIAGMRDHDQNGTADTSTVDDIHTVLARFGDDAATLSRQLNTLLDSRRIRSLPRISRERLDRLLPAVLTVSAQQAEPASTALRLLNLIEQVASRSAYLALMAEYPDILARLARIVSASPWAAHYLTQYPLLLDGLIEWNALMAPPDFTELAAQLQGELDACVLPDGKPDVEQQMNLMRDMQHQVTFQLLAQDLAGLLTVETLADHLSALADMLLEETIRRVWPLVQPDPASRPPHFAVIAYGKLGGKELGYASDLDLVFLYDDPDALASERYARLGRRMSSWLSTLTSSGRLYEVDLRLRPDGDAGLLAVSIDAFEQYQTRHAWPWEHQAITRARFVAGDAAIGARFNTVREHVLLLERDGSALKADVRAMRDRISAGHPNPSFDFDIKHDRGGMVDVEFIVQYLVLYHAREHHALLENLGNIALLRIAAELALIPQRLAQQVADAYRSYRRRQHALRLQGAERARVPREELQDERTAVQALWDHVLED